MFKEGDRIITTHSCSYFHTIGQVGTIKQLEEDECHLVMFDSGREVYVGEIFMKHLYPHDETMTKYDDYTYEFCSRNNENLRLKEEISDLKAEIAWYRGYLRGILKEEN